MPPSFTSEYAYQVLERTCRTVGLSADGASLLRMGENAIFRLADRAGSLVVRVTRDLTRLGIAERELCVSRWLNGPGGVPAARVYEDVPDQPLVVGDHPVSFWWYVPSADDPPTVHDLAVLLRAFHSAGEAPCDLPTFDPLGTVRPRLERGLALDRDEVSAVGPREWDLVPLAVGVTRLGLPSWRWDEFVTAYGFDVRAWSGYPVFREIRELGMTTWLAQNMTESEAITKEVGLRIQSLRDGDLTRAWTAF